MRLQSPTHAVMELLITLFGSALEIRIFVRSLTALARIDNELPDNTVSVAQMAHALVGRLTVHGALDGRFFADLAAIRPLRTGEILAVAASFADPCAAGLTTSMRGVLQHRAVRWITLSVAALTISAMGVAFLAPASETDESDPKPGSEPTPVADPSSSDPPIRDPVKRVLRKIRPPVDMVAPHSEVESADCQACKPWSRPARIGHRTSYGGVSRREISISPEIGDESLPAVAGWRLTPSELLIGGPSLDFKLLNRGPARFLTELVLDLKLLEHTAEPLIFASMTADPPILRFMDLEATPKGPCTVTMDVAPALTIPAAPPRFHANTPAWSATSEIPWTNVPGAPPLSLDRIVYGVLTCPRSQADAARPWVTKFIALTERQTVEIGRDCDGTCGYGRVASVPERIQYPPAQLGELLTAGSITVPIAHVLEPDEAEWFTLPLSVTQSGTYEVTYRILDQDGEVFSGGALHAHVIAPLNSSAAAPKTLLEESYLQEHGAYLRENISQAWKQNCGETPMVGRIELELARVPGFDESVGTIARVQGWTAGDPPLARPEQEKRCLERAIVGHPVGGPIAAEGSFVLVFE